ncbi:AAA family ATPase [Micromonospora sp. STR1_7]|uniref:AAA family ATPase n=1 Tax=Micromonospora parastrephiae TaxID=2806101 RepID=A0ABS1XPB8_9ACTN|nr:AAA family ATPase [Micromonospora parastrephiae]MBM0231082.1 AAA family ATPase [Micromonospora parastrephiae]
MPAATTFAQFVHHHNSMIDGNGRTAGRPVHWYDRSPLCTLALARYLGRAIGWALAAEVERAVRERTYQRLVFLISPLGFVERTAVRRIGYAESLAFARVHEEVYEAYGFHLVHVPARPVAERVTLVEKYLSTDDGGIPTSRYFT